MNPLARKVFPFLFAGLALLALSACSNEAGERKAFIEFLQMRIVDQPGLRVPKLTDEEQKSLGRSAAQYAVIGDFNDSMGKAFNEASPAIQTMASLSTPQALVQGQARIGEARAALAKVKGQLGDQLSKTQADRAKLEQPDDLKTVFQAAYEKTVVKPSELMLKVLDQTDGILAEAQDFSAFLKANEASVTFNGPLVEVNSPALLEELNAHLGALNDKRQKLMELQSELNAMVR